MTDDLWKAPKSDRTKLLALLVVVCTAVALVVLAIDMNIKRDLLKLASRTHTDLATFEEGNLRCPKP